MKKYILNITRVIKGTTEVWADNEDHAISKLYKQPPFLGEIDIESEEDEITQQTLKETNNK
jgi:hypothetical protein